MIVLSYDIADDKLRTKFSKFLCKYGHRIQYSVFEIDNSKNILNNIISNITIKFEKKFTEKDSIYIFNLSSSCEILKMGYAKNEDCDMIVA